MHRLVQLATLEWLELHKQKEQWRHWFLTKLCEEMPTGKYENWAACWTLLPHTQFASTKIPEALNSRREWAAVLYRAAWYCLETGNGSGAKRLSVLAMKARKKEVIWSIRRRGIADYGYGSVDVQEARPVGRGGEAGGASDRDFPDEDRGRSSPYANQHGQPRIHFGAKIDTQKL